MENYISTFDRLRDIDLYMDVSDPPLTRQDITKMIQSAMDQAQKDQQELELLRAQEKANIVTIDHLTTDLQAKRNDIQDLITVMVAAAEEIQEHWDAHCDEDGYGPANLMHRLEKGIAAYYPGYTPGEFEKAWREIEKLKSERDQFAIGFQNWFEDFGLSSYADEHDLNEYKASLH